MDKLISVIVPIYNVEQWLNECIESIVNQTYKNLEIILVDDGSPDSCPQMCDEWESKDERIKVIHKENGGLSSARNAGLDICTGDYISFIDSDDFLELNAYQILIDDMDRYNVDAVRFLMSRYKDGNVIDNNLIHREKMYNKEELLDCYFYQKEDVCGGVCDKLYKKYIFDNVRFPEGINCEDYYANVQIYSKINSIYYNNISLYMYRMRDESISRKTSLDDHSFDKIKVSDMVYEYVESNMKERINDARILQACARFAVYYKTMLIPHSHEDEKKWQDDLRKFESIVRGSAKLEKNIKIKYLIMSRNIRLYMMIKKVLRKV